MYTIDELVADLRATEEAIADLSPDCEPAEAEALHAHAEKLLATLGGDVDWLAEAHHRITAAAEATEAERKALSTRLLEPLQRRQRALQGAAAWLKHHAENVVREMGGPISGTRYTLALRSCPPAVVVADDADPMTWPADCRRVEPIKSALAARLRAGEEITGATFTQGTTLQIKVKR